MFIAISSNVDKCVECRSLVGLKRVGNEVYGDS